MPVSEEALKLKLERFKKTLTPKQQEFLEARPLVKSDAEACRQIGSSDTSVPRWKKNSNFYTAYVIVTQMLEANRELLISDVNKQTIVRLQEAALLAYLPKAVQMHIDIIVNGKSDEHKIRAIKMLYDYVGIGPSSGVPISKNNQALMNIISLIGPQARDEAKKRGLDSDAGISDVIRSAGEDIDPAVMGIINELDEPADTSDYEEE